MSYISFSKCFCTGVLLLAGAFYATSQPIPGASSKYDTDRAIEALMDAERVRLKRLENDLDTYQQKKSVWLRLNRQMSEVRESALALYGFESPFNNKIASSSNPSLITAIADRNAVEETRSIQVKRTAAADRFISRSLPRDFTAPAGSYRFRVGKQEAQFEFRGGSLKELVRAINSRAGRLLKASVVRDTRETQVMVIESRLTGSANQLSFQEMALELAERAGILERSPIASRSIPISRLTVQPWQKTLEEVSIAEETLTLNPRAEARIPFTPPLEIEESFVLSLEMRTRIIPEQEWEEPQPPPGPEPPPVGGISFQGIEIQSARSKTFLPEWKPPERPERIDDMQVLFAEGRSGRIQPLPQIRDSGEFTILTFEAGELPKTIVALTFRNRNTHRVVELRNIRVYDKRARDEYRPRRPLSEAQDAVITLDGIEVVRDTNQIDDLIPGVTLTLHGAGEVKLSVGKDLESIEEALLRFIGNYNQLLTWLDIVTRRDEEVIQDARYLSEEERESAWEELGLLMGNVSLMQLKSRLQGIMMNPYSTEGGQEMRLLAQLGISTSAGRIGDVLDRTRLRGYLRIDNNRLKEALARNTDWVGQLFGYDTDRDLVVDSGIAYRIDTYLKSYEGTGGIVDNRIDTLNSSIARVEGEIEDYNEHLADYEQELRREFGQMETALDYLDKSSKIIENLE